MTDIEHAKKYAEESISLAISMYNPKAEIIAETACLYGLTFKNERIAELEKENADLHKSYDDLYFSMRTLREENAELKEKLEVVIALKDEEIGCIQTDFNTFKSKAKELLNRFIETSNPIYFEEDRQKVKAEAEQFLSEVEKCGQ